MYNAAQPASNGGTRHQAIGETIYRVDRILIDDGFGSGCIEIRHAPGGEVLARVSYDGMTRELTMDTVTVRMPRDAMEWLFHEADSWLA